MATWSSALKYNAQPWHFSGHFSQPEAAEITTVNSQPYNFGKFVNAKTIWSALLIGAFVQVRIGIPATPIIVQVSLFDAVLPIIVFWGIYKHWLHPPSALVSLVFLSLLLAVFVHSAILYAIQSDINVTWLMKDTIRLVVVILHMSFLMILFQREDMRIVPKRSVAGLTVTMAVFAVIVFKYELFFTGELFLQELISSVHVWPFIVSPTIQATTLLGLLFLIGSDGKWVDTSSHRLWMIIGSIFVGGAAILLLHKASAAVGLLFGVWFTIAGAGSRVSLYHILFSALLALIGSGLAGFIIYQFELFPEIAERLDSIDRSIGIRLELWTFAAHEILGSFPVGLGLGQFSQAAGQIPKFAAETHFYPHNSPLSFLAELGLIGLVILILLCAVLFRSSAGYSKYALPLFIVLMAPPLLLHDGHTIRILLLVVALGLMRPDRTATSVGGAR